jgi:preprotein translocase subunit SecA
MSRLTGRGRPRRAFAVGVVRGAYPEREDTQLSTLDELGETLVAPVLRRRRGRKSRWQRVPERVAAHAAGLAEADDESLRARAAQLGLELREWGYQDERVAQMFALVRELASRTLGKRHYDVQLIGGWVLLHGMVTEMETGEGKTLTATLAVCTAALAGVPVHVITVNDYLARRDAEMLTPLYAALGLSVGVVVSGMDPAARRAAYACDVTYCTNKEVAFDYLKDRIALRGHPSRLRLQLERLSGGGGRAERVIHRGLHFAIVDEADSILVDEARTPLIISSRKGDAAEEEIYRTALAVARELEVDVDFAIEGPEREIALTADGRERVRELGEPRGGVFRGRRRREEFVRQALVALHLFHRDQHYLVQDDQVQIVDEYTGRLMPDRSWEHGLHQLIEVKEDVSVTGRQDTLARISYQRFFRRYHRLAGMTGTAREVSAELWSVYGLAVATVPTNRPCGRELLGERVLATADEKWERVVTRIGELHGDGRPVLVGTRSVAASEHLSALLDAAGLSHVILNARQDREEAEIVARAGAPGRITVATNMAGRGTDIELAPGVAEIGGLHVLATERHDARRIDRQLFGRCGRQGDPGTAEAIVSLEDELCRVYGGAPARRLAGLVGAPDSRLGSWAGRFALGHSQRAAGRLHSRMRRDLLKLDAQLDSTLAFSGRPE